MFRAAIENAISISINPYPSGDEAYIHTNTGHNPILPPLAILSGLLLIPRHPTSPTVRRNEAGSDCSHQTDPHLSP